MTGIKGNTDSSVRKSARKPVPSRRNADPPPIDATGSSKSAPNTKSRVSSSKAVEADLSVIEIDSDDSEGTPSQKIAPRGAPARTVGGSRKTLVKPKKAKNAGGLSNVSDEEKSVKRKTAAKGVKKTQEIIQDDSDDDGVRPTVSELIERSLGKRKTPAVTNLEGKISVRGTVQRLTPEDQDDEEVVQSEEITLEGKSVSFVDDEAVDFVDGDEEEQNLDEDGAEDDVDAAANAAQDQGYESPELEYPDDAPTTPTRNKSSQTISGKRSRQLTTPEAVTPPKSKKKAVASSLDKPVVHKKGRSLAADPKGKTKREASPQGAPDDSDGPIVVNDPSGSEDDEDLPVPVGAGSDDEEEAEPEPAVISREASPEQQLGPDPTIVPEDIDEYLLDAYNDLPRLERSVALTPNSELGRYEDRQVLFSYWKTNLKCYLSIPCNEAARSGGCSHLQASLRYLKAALTFQRLDSARTGGNTFINLSRMDPEALTFTSGKTNTISTKDNPTRPALCVSLVAVSSEHLGKVLNRGAWMQKTLLGVFLPIEWQRFSSVACQVFNCIDGMKARLEGNGIHFATRMAKRPEMADPAPNASDLDGGPSSLLLSPVKKKPIRAAKTSQSSTFYPRVLEADDTVPVYDCRLQSLSRPFNFSTEIDIIPTRARRYHKEIKAGSAVLVVYTANRWYATQPDADHSPNLGLNIQWVALLASP